MGFFSRLSRYLDDTLLLPEEARELAEAARGHLEAGEPEEALAAASAALASRPDHPQLLYLAGEALARLGERAEAERMLREVLAEEPGHAPSRVALGRVLAAGGRFEEAAAELRRGAAQLVGSRERDLAAEALADLSDCHLRLGRPDRAARELRKAVSLRPDDPRLQAALARALVDEGDRRTARAVASRAAERAMDSSESDLLGMVGEAALAAGLHDQAVLLLRRAVLLGSPSNLALGRALEAAGDVIGAHEQALRALADEPGSAEPHRLLADLALRTGDHRGALGALKTALGAEPGHAPTLKKAIAAAARVDLPQAGALAESLLALEPASPLGLSVRSRARLAEGRLDDVAGALSEVAARAPREAEAWLGLAELAVLERRADEALDAIERVEALEPSRPELDRLSRSACLLVATAGSEAEPDLFDVLERAHGLLAERGELADLAVEVARVREDYDRPLLLTVMGEFNAGKSTFINALVGEPVAPMGITPTTATINVLKYGTERRARVLHTTGIVKELEYEALGAWLKGLSRSAAVEVRQVEILYPAEELTRVNLVDTPGFNSLVPEHEAVARQFIERADAVVWLFDAGQPGKDTERRALETVAAQGKRVLGVLNKADRLAEGALEVVLGHVRQEGLGGLLEDIVPLSARSALEAKTAKDADRLAASGLGSVEAALDRLFYSRSRQIKRSGCASRLVTILDEARARESASNGELRRSVTVLELLRGAVPSLGERIAAALAEPALRGLAEVGDRVASEAAIEVLEFVRPRRHALDSHRFGPEDRAYLVELVEERLESGLGSLGLDLVRPAAAVLAEALGRLDEATASLARLPSPEDEGAELVRQLGWSIFVFHKGLLRGGAADRFFDDDLPRIDLDAGAIAARIAEWWTGRDGEIRGLLERGASEACRRLDVVLGAEVARLRGELARSRRSGVRPLAGFAELARGWSE